MAEEKNTDICSKIIFSPDGTIVVSGYQSGLIHVWNLETKKEMAVLKGHKDRINALAFTSDSKILVSGSSDKRIIVWDAFKGELLKVLRGHWGKIKSLAINNEGTLLASGSTDKKIKIWDIQKDWKKIQDFKGHEDSIAEVKFSPIENTFHTRFF